MEGINISYPVMWSDEVDYLNVNINGEKDIAGSIYLEPRIKDLQSSVLLIHGHNMMNGTMFGGLKNLRNLDFTKENNLFYLYDGESLYEATISNINLIDASAELFPIQFRNEVSMGLYVSQMKNRAVVNLDTPVTDRLIVLNTCSNENQNTRLVVMANLSLSNKNPLELGGI